MKIKWSINITKSYISTKDRREENTIQVLSFSCVDEAIIESTMSVTENLSLKPKRKRQKIKDSSSSSSSSSSSLACLNDKKLHLVLDLDHTLIHTIKISHLSESEKYLIKKPNSKRKDLIKFKSNSIKSLIKLRPFIHEFLEEANKLFIMYVYTMGNSNYGKLVLKLIDPNQIYFGNRLISREESPLKKTLDLVLADERAILIVDDTRDVWPDHKSNLVEISKYMYFRGKDVSVSKSYAEEKRDENGNDGGLAKVFKILKQVHRRFFSCKRFGENEDLSFKDVRLILQEIDHQV